MLLGTFMHSGTLGVGESYENVVNVALPANVSGEMFITAWADALNAVPEDTFSNVINLDDPNELDNNNYKARSITVVLRPPPDLVVTDVVPQSVGVGGYPFTVQWAVKNRGFADTQEESWTDTVYLSDMPDLNAQDAKRWSLGYVQHTGRLAVGESYTAQATFTLSPATAGKFVIVETNSGMAVAKAFEGPYTDPTFRLNTPVNSRQNPGSQPKINSN